MRLTAQPREATPAGYNVNGLVMTAKVLGRTGFPRLARIMNTPLCRYGITGQTPAHLVLFCPELEQEQGTGGAKESPLTVGCNITINVAIGQ